jgi:hypothetical protein
MPPPQEVVEYPSVAPDGAREIRGQMLFPFTISILKHLRDAT